MFTALILSLITFTAATGCRGHVEIIADDGFHHSGYYDYHHHNWHSGYYDHHFHDDPNDWHHY
jgi:hypothetical protein